MTRCALFCHLYAIGCVALGCCFIGLAVACFKSPRVARMFGEER